MLKKEFQMKVETCWGKSGKKCYPSLSHITLIYLLESWKACAVVDPKPKLQLWAELPWKLFLGCDRISIQEQFRDGNLIESRHQRTCLEVCLHSKHSFIGIYVYLVCLRNGVNENNDSLSNVTPSCCPYLMTLLTTVQWEIRCGML